MSALAMPTQNRRRSPKVRTGCFTCKIRRVKCDEAKPMCLRCTSTGRKCDGYPEAKDSFQAHVPTSKELVVKPLPAVSMLSGLGDSVRHLEFYHRYAVPTLSSRFDHEFWSKVSLQMAHSEPAVRHAVIALGYLNKIEPGNLKHARMKFQVINGNKVLLYHYNQAVRRLIERMAEPSYSPEIGMVTCLLFVCIEYLRANYCTAFTHMTNGLRLISEWQQQRKIDAPLQGSACTTGPTGLIEEILLPMFQRGITSAQLYGVKTEDHLDIPFPDPDRFLKLPFSLEEAERSSRELRNASVLFLRQVGFKHMGKIPLDVADTVQQAQLLECHRVWFERVQIAEDTLRWSKNDRVSLSALKVPFDKYLHTFKALIRNAEIVLDAMDLNKTHSAKFTFEASIIPPLNHTATRCRCPSTRRKAISLLERGPPREGLWDAEQHVLVTRRVVELEEAELDPETGWPVERTRIYSSVTDGNMDVNGGFWVYFIPSAWVGEVDATGKQRQWQERFHM